MVDPSDPFHDSRPSGILPAKSGFSVAKFLGLTVALAAGAGAGIGGYVLLQRNAANGDDPPPEESGSTGGAEGKAKPDVPATRPPDVPAQADAPDPDAPLRLDIPDHPSNRRSGSDHPGPDVEVPNWDE